MYIIPISPRYFRKPPFLIGLKRFPAAGIIRKVNSACSSALVAVVQGASAIVANQCVRHSGFTHEKRRFQAELWCIHKKVVIYLDFTIKDGDFTQKTMVMQATHIGILQCLPWGFGNMGNCLPSNSDRHSESQDAAVAGASSVTFPNLGSGAQRSLVRGSAKWRSGSHGPMINCQVG